MSPTATLIVSLRGYPEAVLATDALTLSTPDRPTAGAVARDLAARSDRLAEALLHPDGTLRTTTKVIVGGAPVAPDAPIGPWNTVTVLASLPCDG
jgi:hypothetical protein